MTQKTPAEPKSVPSVLDADIDGAQLFSALKREKKWLILPTLAVCGVAALGLMVSKPEYKSSARILIERTNSVYTRPNANTVQASTSDDGQIETDTVVTQTQYLLSRDLAREVASTLNLAELSEFDRAKGQESTVDKLISTMGLEAFFGPSTSEERVLKRYYKKLDIYNPEKSRVIAVDFSSKDPELAAKVANTLAQKYIERRREQVRETTRDAASWLNKEIEGLQRRVEQAEYKVEEYRTKNGIYSISSASTSGQSLTTQQLADVNAQYMAAQSQKAETESKAKQIWHLIFTNQPLESSDILNSGVVQKLNEQIAFVKGEIAQQSATLLPGHPRMQQLTSMVGDLQKQVRVEAERVARGYENDSKIAAIRAETLQQSLGQMKTRSAAANEQEVKLRELERDAKTQRDILESMMARYRDATAQQNLETTPVPARIISVATVSSEPDSPKYGPVMLAAFLGTLLLSALMILIRELLSPRPYVTVLREEPTLDMSRAARASGKK